MAIDIFVRAGIFYLRGTFQKTRVYKSCGTRDRAVAEALRTLEEKAILARLFDSGGAGRRRDSVSFAAAADHYLTKGKNAPHSARTVGFVTALKRHFATKLVAEIDQFSLDDAIGVLVGDDAAPATKRRAVSVPLTAILRHAEKRGWCHAPAFELPTVDSAPTPFFTPREACALIDAAAPHLKPLLIFLFGTGARLSEALYLDWSNVDLGAARVRFFKTKSGNPRNAGLPPAAVAALANLPHRMGAVFRRDDGEPYARSNGFGGQIKKGWASACRRAGLLELAVTPEGEQARDAEGRPIMIPRFYPHCTRHTWATWFHALSRNLILLKHEGGWESDKMVTRYAHLMRSDLEAEVALVWGGAHPAIQPMPRATSVQQSTATA